MKKDVRFYIITIVCIVITFISSYLLPIPEFFKGMITLPGVLTFFGILIEAWRDKRAYENQLDLLRKEQDYSLGIASHMAIIVFDHQVDFCERYVAKANEALYELFSSGPVVKANNYAVELLHIRMEFSAWISPNIEKGLLPFEKALREIGVSAQLAGMDLPQPEHARFVNIMYDTFLRVIDISKPLQDETPEEAITFLVSHLRSVLGITELTILRDQALKFAVLRTEG